MEPLLNTKRGFPPWSQTPIPHFQPSAGGLLALADLGTIANRTAIVGGSSWLDSLLLAPGLHYQQAADALAGDQTAKAEYDAVEIYNGKSLTYRITNPATIRYLQRLASTGHKIVVDVACVPTTRMGTGLSFRSRAGGSGADGGGGRRSRRGVGQRATIWADRDSDLGWVSHLLYLAAPVLTILAFVFMILLQEWWGVALLLALMFSRALNIWVIKQRANQRVSIPTPPPSPPPLSPLPDLGDLLTEYVVDLGHGRSVSLRGLASDLKAITTGPWLSTKTHVQGYLEATAKLTVYLVAAFSGNMTQSGNLVFMALLIITAGLLGLSNAHARTLRMHGRIAAPTTDRLPYHDDNPRHHHHNHQPPSLSSLSPPYLNNTFSSPPLSGSGGEKSIGSPPLDQCASSVDGGSSPYPDSGSWGVDSSSTWPPGTTATATMTRNSTAFSGLEDHEEV